MDKKRILIVDDEPSFTRLVKVYLEGMGRYEVREEQRGAHALDAAHTFHPDLILLDVIMPDLDGATVAAKIKADPIFRNIPIVFVTAIVSRQETGPRAKRIGGYPFLAKPVSMDAMITCIEQQLGNMAGATSTEG